MRLNLIKPEPTLGKGWASVAFKECVGIAGFQSMAITRPSHRESYLGKFGWQISECRLPLTLENIGETEFSILLPPAIVQYMDVSGNYKFIFFDRNVQQSDSVIFRWSGISYREPAGERSPIEVVMQDDNAELHKFTDIRAAEDSGKTEEPNFGSTAIDDTTSTGSWHVHDDDWSAPKAEPLLIYAETIPSTPTLASQHMTPKKFQRVRCINPNCEAEILDNMKICPFCNTERMKC
jgi:hypothetical protein